MGAIPEFSVSSQDTTLKGFLIVVATWSAGEQKFAPKGISTSGIFDVFACSSTTRGAMNKWRPPPDSAHQIGLETPWVAFLIVGW